MFNLKYILSVLFVCFLININLMAQNDSSNASPVFVQDASRFKLHFEKGDTLIYNLYSLDSIIIDFGKPLIKTRNEKIRIVCDSSINGIFYLSQQLIDFNSKEHLTKEEPVDVMTNPWLNRKVYYSIDSVGKRYSIGVDDSSKAALCPGGAFQPFLFFPFDVDIASTNHTWIVESNIKLPENGIPPSFIRETRLMKYLSTLDTIGEKCARLQFINTGQGGIMLDAGEDKINLSSVINGHGTYDISLKNCIPVHFFVGVELKLTLTFSDDVKKPGSQYINSYFTLVDYKHKESEALQEKPQKIKKKKK